MTEAESEKRIDGVTGSSGRLITRVSPGHFKIVATAEGYGLAVQRTIVKAGNVEAVIKLYPRENSNSVLPIPLPITGHKWETPPLWQPQPALIIGMGGTGRHVLTHLKKNLLDAGAGKIADTVRFVLLDTSDYELLEGQQVSVSFAGVSLSAEDIVEFGDDLNPLKEALLRDPKSEPEMSGWFPAANYHTRLAPDELNLAHGTRQRRPPARATLVRDLKKGLPTKGTNVILLIGRSETMGNPFSVGDSSISKLEAAKQATVHLVEQLNLSLDRVAVIQFDENAEIICPFSQDRKIIRNSIEGIQPGRGISLHKGLQIAQQLSTERGGDETFPAVILVTDAQSYPESTLESAQALKQSGTRLVVIGLDNANENLLRQVVTCTNNAPHYYKALDSLEISRICKSLARQLGEGSQLWRLISGAARDSMDGDELRIILVGSLAGGYGSAILTDIAYLTRHAGYFLGAKV